MRAFVTAEPLRLAVPSACWLMIAGAFAVAPPSACADADLDRGIELADRAEFESALAAFDRAQARGRLTREELVRMLEQRALVCFALGEHDAMRRDLANLAALEPDAVLPPATPPPVRQAFERQRGARLVAQAEHERVAEGVLVRVDVSGDPGGLVRAVRTFGRSDEGAFVAFEGRAITIGAPRDVEVEYYVELIGPAGAPLLAIGSASAPRRVDAVIATPALAPTTVVPSGGDDALWWIVGMSAGAAVLAAIAIGVLVGATGGGADTLLTGPQVRTP